MPYIGRSMSTNAKKAHDQGLMPISSFGRKQLDQCGFKYSVGFFRWLCKKNYIKSNGLHHTGAAPRLTKFYSPGTIGSFAGQANLPALYAMYRGKMTEEEAFESLGVKYYKIECAAGLLGMKYVGTLVCDVIYYDGYFYLSNCGEEHLNFEIQISEEEQRKAESFYDANKNKSPICLALEGDVPLTVTREFECPCCGAVFEASVPICREWYRGRKTGPMRDDGLLNNW